MLRQSIAKGSGLAASTSRRALSNTARVMAGDTGKYGAASSDAFQKREKASEDYAIRQREKEKLMELKQKLAEQQVHLKKLSDHIDEITKGQGGEHN
ncbi:mitochondrial ATPase inhibitor [Microdochium nivale]|nr:mitochondrial ATPase inhibitor [Microdochium nivale]